MEDGSEVVLLTLRPGVTRIGRSSSARTWRSTTAASRDRARGRHDPLRRVAPRSLDDGSLNGTLVNGERVQRRVLRDGDVVTVGRRDLRFLEVRVSARAEAPTEELRPAAPRAVATA